MSLDRLITACLCSWGLKSGYVEVPVRDAVGRGFDIVFGEKYFGSCADVREHTVFVSSSDEDSKRLEFLVFFDCNLHCNGTQRCPYLLRSYSNRFGSKGLRPQLICCAPFLSIAPYFRILYLSYLKIQMAIVAYPKVWTTIIWYPDVETSIVFLSKDKE
jgi:hypothetical protein